MRMPLHSAIFVVCIAMSVCAATSTADAQVQRGKWFDVSVAVNPATTPVYQGDPPPEFTWKLSIEKGDKLNLSDLHLGAHTGTHIDAPLHFIRNGETVDQISLDKLIGPALVIECSKDAKIIDAAELNRHS